MWYNTHNEAGKKKAQMFDFLPEEWRFYVLHLFVCAAKRNKINKSQEKPIMWKHMLIIKQDKIVFIYMLRKKIIYFYKYLSFHTGFYFALALNSSLIRKY